MHIPHLCKHDRFPLGGWSLSILLAGLLALAPSLPCLAQPAVLAQIKSLYEQSLQNFDNLRMDEAQANLQQAIGLADTHGIKDPVVAQLHLRMGVILLVAQEDENQTFQEFVKALQVDPACELDPLISTQQLEKIFNNARDAMQITPGGSQAPLVPGERLMLVHTAVSEAAVNQQVIIKVEVPDLVNVTRAVVFYKAESDYDYQQAELMARGANFYEGSFPSLPVVGERITYYIEASDPSGKVVAGSSSREDPHVVRVIQQLATPGPTVVPTTGPLPGLGPAQPAPLGTGPEVIKEERKYFFLSLSIGTGVGYATGELQEHPNDPDYLIKPGMASSPLHLFAELGGIILPSLHITVMGRIQLIDFDYAVGGRIKWLFDSNPPLKFYGAVGFAYGHVRHRIDLAPAHDETDYTAEGPALANLGIGLIYEFNSTVGMVVEITPTVYFGDFFSFQVDATAGLAFAF